MYQIKDTCVGCHNCAMECPTGAISFKGLKYWIDETKCVECGLCAKVCHTCSAVEVKPETSESHPRLIKDCDVVVAGGGSGLIAAVRAAQNGKGKTKVILLEKMPRLGGNTDYAHMFFPVYSRLHAEAGLADLREEAVLEYVKRSGGIIDPGISRACVYGCGDFLDWLLEFPEVRDAFEIHAMGDVAAFGPVYSSGVLHFPKRLHENLLCRDQAIGPGWAGTMIRHTLLKAIQDEELWVEILTGTSATKLLQDESGAISGVLAKDAGGEIEIRAKAVILATGGFGRSDEKLQKHFGFFDCETPIHRFSVPGDTGDAIDMLEDLGVKPPKDRMNISIFGPAHHPFSYCVLRIMEHPSSLSVNLNGKRWQNEENGLFGGRFIIHKQPKEIAWSILSLERAYEVAKSYIADPAYRDEAWLYESYKEDLEEEISLSPFAPVRRADTIEALAEKIGAPPDALAETVKRYNEFCKNGLDSEFKKDPKNLIPLGDGPYLAIYGQRFSEAAFGGVRVTPKCEATREDGTVIPGLYAVGDATSAMHGRGELAAISEMTWATASAWLSGGNAYAYAKEAQSNA